MLDSGAVRVAVEDCGEFCVVRIEAQRREIVQKVDVVAFEEKNIGFRQMACGAGAVDVAADCVDWSNFRERLEDRPIADVAEMENVVHASQSRRHFRTEKTVGVANNADFHR